MSALRQSTRQTLSKYSPPLQLAGGTSKTGDGPKNGGPSTKLTQEDQDKADKETQREAMRDLVQTWLDRLQLISVITTFFASTEASLIGIAIPSRADAGLSTAGYIANIGLMCALVIHCHAAIISFLAAFFLIRYKLVVAEKDEETAEKLLVTSPTSMTENDLEKDESSLTSPYADNLLTDPVYGRVRVQSELTGDQIIWSTNPHLVQVGPFQRQPPTLLLARSHSLCVFLAFVGFVLALMGTVSFAWDRLPLSVSVFATSSMAFCVVAGALILLVPSTKTSHIYYDRKSR